VLTAIASGWPSVIDESTQPPVAEKVDAPMVCAPGGSLERAPVSPAQEADTAGLIAVPAPATPGAAACHASALDQAF